ncbi:ATP-binding protein [Nocardia farcinica]|uniref:ATP-binding protein n=1 Tax=Nocardia farcinica TaxID=37329 RepID=UPI001896101C|nr:ATP-binding protein [Nocardia farcinica]MBF6269976.1 HAMP domain-containing protein [Nocardia farcinica]MBF6293226.1 HAMP domain-containing protein [Nocardia farcinica]MBF6373097.1 HAMP domain-containing protein [Nocardia farcinica]MBF6377083.1 HAMP domain-containing protein [Nocardia farcinica]MBF6443995.1 HAMP domain-containing protein [Nocardia farcinica]
MRDAARSGKKRWALGNWDLRWKVTAVLAVPLAVAVGLGVSRITSEFTEANRLEGVAENIEAIPAVTGLSAAAATVAGSQMVSLMPGASVVTDQDLSQLDQAITTAQDAGAKLRGHSKAEASLETMITEARAILARGKAAAQPTDALGGIDRIRNESVSIVESTVSQVSDPAMDAAKLRLVDSLNTRATLVAELAAFNEVLHDFKAGVQTFTTASETERQLLNVLAHRFPDGDSAIADLRAGVDTRLSLINSPEAQAGRLPLGELKNSLTTSVDVYERVVAKATKDIDSAMDNLAGRANRDAWTYTAVVIATILAALLLAVFVARSMIVPLHRLRLAALRVAESDLPHEVAQLRNGASPEDVPLEPMPIRSTEEIGQLARAIDDIHGQALRLASDQAQMRSQVNDMFETLARRSKSLVDHQLSLIEAMEYDEKDPRLLENLFRLDHLAARMRRNGDNLLILAGTKQRRAKSAPVEIGDVLRAAISEVEDYERVKLGATPRGALKEPAASDLAHLFAELLDNALRASPPETDVKFTFAQAHDQGLLIEVADRGIGMPPAEMAEINRKLEQTAEPGPDTARHMGLFVVGRLAERHGLTVRLRPTFDTARDPGVTVTVHVPVGLIVPAGQASGPQAVVKAAPVQPNPQHPTPSMQTRAITRTSAGNMMVTVDPGVSGPIQTGSGPLTPPAPAPTGPGGLPQRQPGSAMAGGLRQEGSASLRESSAAAQANGPQRGKLAAASLPKRNLAPGGPAAAQRPSVTPPATPGTAGPAGATPGGLPQREPGANGVPQPGAGGGLPQRQPGASGAPQPEAGGLPQRQPGGNGAPAPTAGGLPQRQPGGNGAPAPTAGGLPHREPGANGAPEPDVARGSAATGLPQRESGPARPGGNGLPQRQPGATPGLPQREPGATGLHREGGAAGLPPREGGPSGLPPREAGPNGLPQRGAPAGGLPPRDGGPSGLPQREAGPNGLPQRGAAPGGLPQREGAAGLAPRDGGAPGLPQREGGATGLPPRDNGATGLPQRAPGAPAAGEGGPNSTGLPQRGANGLPQRGGLPQRDSGLPERESGANGLPQRAPEPSRPAPGTGLPQRDPGARHQPLGEVPPGVGLAQRDSGTEAGDGASESAPARDPGKHSYKSNPAKTASFFQTRLQPAVEPGSSMDSPIFAEMMSAWLADPNPDRSQVAASFESPGDEGWQAARRASEAQAEKKTAAGLPQRDPGGRLVPGAVSGAADRAPRRDPESIRSSLSRHQKGVRDGRAMRAMNLTGDKGDR